MNIIFERLVAMRGGIRAKKILTSLKTPDFSTTTPTPGSIRMIQCTELSGETSLMVGNSFLAISTGFSDGFAVAEASPSPSWLVLNHDSQYKWRIMLQE